MPEMMQLLGTLIAAAAGGFAAYVAIKSDLADLKARMNGVEKSSDQAHDRIDKILHSKD
jgi:hypothetical protein